MLDHRASAPGSLRSSHRHRQLSLRWTSPLVASASWRLAVWSGIRDDGRPYPCISALLPWRKRRTRGTSGGIARGRRRPAAGGLQQLAMLACRRFLFDTWTKYHRARCVPGAPLCGSWSSAEWSELGAYGSEGDPEVFGADKRRYSWRCPAPHGGAIVAGDTARVASWRSFRSAGGQRHVRRSLTRPSTLAASCALSVRGDRLEDGRSPFGPSRLQRSRPQWRPAARWARNEGYRLLNTYARDERKPTELSRLVEDVAVPAARSNHRHWAYCSGRRGRCRVSPPWRMARTGCTVVEDLSGRRGSRAIAPLSEGSDFRVLVFAGADRSAAVVAKPFAPGLQRGQCGEER